jgi:RHS repeat-associated protein
MTAATYDGDGLRATATYGASTEDFVWNDVNPLPQVLMDSGNAYIYTGSVAPAEQVNLASGSVTYLVTDSLGSVRGVTNSSGALTATTGYDAWGNPETTGGLSASTPFGYAGGYTDATGLVYLLARYFNPQSGQFISVDPELSQTNQPYGYASGNPVSVNDPTGQWACTSTSQTSLFRTCSAFLSVQQVHNIEFAFGLWGIGVGGSLTAAGFAALKRAAIAQLCEAALEACIIISATIAALILYINWNDHGHGEYLKVAEWRYALKYLAITWSGVHWAYLDGPWIPYFVWTQSIG